MEGIELLIRKRIGLLIMKGIGLLIRRVKICNFTRKGRKAEE